MPQSKLDFIQHEMLRIALSFHHFCEENNLKYAICGGTLLGAVRHKNFIPWDDDFDVFMPRGDFERFLEIWKDHNDIELKKNGDSDYYKIATPAKLHNPKTKVIELNEIENGVSDSFLNHGIFIDVFPIDFYPDNKIGAMLNNYIGKINIKKSLSRFPMHTLSWRHRKVISIFKYIPQYVIDKIVDVGLNQVRENSLGKIGYGVESAITNLWVDADVIFPFKKVKCIAGHEFYMPAQPEAYLAHRFGDFMTLPPKDKQFSHICKLYVNGEEYI
ncbi:phosphorylcholine transferase LicD [Salmonella enterica subsp. enterica serovar Choleraesuis]|nr:phosphorylcholine transferase LicD [Salmonella enterica subsp. enterica serovar Choleraesuis]